MSNHTHALRKFCFACVIVGLIGFVLLVVGVLTPAWSVSRGRHDVTIQEGIWYARACSSRNKTCVVSSRQWIFEHFGLPGAFSVLEPLHWQEFRVMTVLGMEGALNAVLAASIVLVRKGKPVSTFVMAIGLVSSLAACSLVIIPVFKVNQVTSSTWSSDWSRLMACIGAVLELICSALYVFTVTQNCVSIIKKKYDDDNVSDTPDSGVVYEPDSSDESEDVRDPGLELPAYSEGEYFAPPPYSYTDLVDFQPHRTENGNLLMNNGGDPS